MKKKTLTALKYLFLIVASVLSIFPFFWMIISATNSAREVNAGKLTFGAHLPDNLANLFHSDLAFGASLANSVWIAVITTVLALLISSVAGYGFEIFRSRARDRVFNILLLSMMVPFCALMIPLYRMFSAAGKAGFAGVGLNTMFSVIVPYICTAFLIFFFRQNTKSFPKDILEAARIDGLNEPGIFFHMYVPVMRSTYAAGAIVTFMTSWNNYLWPLVALQEPRKRTVPLILSAMGSSYTPDYGMIMAGIVLATLPTGLIFFFMQKQFVAGIVGSVK